jgi:hypothetical protein
VSFGIVGLIMVPSKTAGVAAAEGAECRVHCAANFVDRPAVWAPGNGFGRGFVAHACSDSKTTSAQFRDVTYPAWSRKVQVSMKQYVRLSVLMIGFVCSPPAGPALARQASAVAGAEVRVVAEPLGVWCDSRASFLVGIENVTDAAVYIGVPKRASLAFPYLSSARWQFGNRGGGSGGPADVEAVDVHCAKSRNRWSRSRRMSVSRGRMR